MHNPVERRRDFHPQAAEIIARSRVVRYEFDAHDAAEYRARIQQATMKLELDARTHRE